MPMYTSDGGPILTDAQVNDLLVQPVVASAVASQDNVTSTVVQLSAGGWRAPRVTADPSAQWVNEGEEISPSDATLDEIEAVPRKVAGLTIVSSELLDDSNETAADIIGSGLVRDIQRKVDAAWLGNLTAPAPGGLASTGYSEVAAGPLDSLDAFALAVSEAEQLDAALTAWVTGPSTALRLAQLRDGEGSNRSLLGTDPTLPTRRVVEGRPVLVAPGVPDGEVWGIPASRCFTLVRQDAEVVADTSPFFTSDRVAIRAIMRVGFGFTQPEAIQHLTFDAPAAA